MATTNSSLRKHTDTVTNAKILCRFGHCPWARQRAHMGSCINFIMGQCLVNKKSLGPLHGGLSASSSSHPASPRPVPDMWPPSASSCASTALPTNRIPLSLPPSRKMPALQYPQPANKHIKSIYNHAQLIRVPIRPLTRPQAVTGRTQNLGICNHSPYF